ncbi:MAG: hypothetical protein ABSG64_10700 [Solirubrobacteraceae bacterium]
MLPLYVAYLNRSGPGNICHYSIHGGESCVQESTPIPWLLVALVLFTVGALLCRSAAARAAKPRQSP